MRKPKTAAHAKAVAETIAAFQPYYKEPTTEARGGAMVKNLGDVLLMLAVRRDEEHPSPGEPPPPAATVSPAPAPTGGK